MLQQEDRWRGTFKGGVNLNEKILKDHLRAFDSTKRLQNTKSIHQDTI